MKFFFFFLLAVCLSAPLFPFDVWSRPEAAEKNSLFLDAHAAALSFTGGFSAGPDTLFVTADYLLPVDLPFSLGAYFKAPNPNLKSFGLRLAYHIDIDNSKTDLYVLYAFDLGFMRNNLLEAYGDEKQEVRYYDFRAGVRRLFGKYFCLSLETAYKLSGITAGISVKFM
jgi:hypothetical protein